MSHVLFTKFDLGSTLNYIMLSVLAGNKRYINMYSTFFKKIVFGCPMFLFSNILIWNIASISCRPLYHVGFLLNDFPSRFFNTVCWVAFKCNSLYSSIIFNSIKYLKAVDKGSDLLDRIQQRFYWLLMFLAGILSHRSYWHYFGHDQLVGTCSKN